MKTFSGFITEGLRKLRWEGSPDIGWWEDQDPIMLYHGTHKSNLRSILKTGLVNFDPNTGYISLALEPNTAFGYASMHGGEKEFRKAGKKARHVPQEDRVVFVFEIPLDWIKKNMGPLPRSSKNLKDREKYEKWNGEDQEFYQLAEIKIRKEVPAKYLKGYMVKR